MFYLSKSRVKLTYFKSRKKKYVHPLLCESGSKWPASVNRLHSAVQFENQKFKQNLCNGVMGLRMSSLNCLFATLVMHPPTPPPLSPSSLSLGSAVGLLFQRHCGGLSGVAASFALLSAKWGQSRGTQSFIHIS